MTRYPDDGDVRDIARALRRRKLILLGVPIVAMAIAYGVAQVQDPVYSASVVVSVARPPAPVDGSVQPALEGDRLVRGQRDVVESDAVRSEVTRRIGPHEPVSTSSSEGRDVIRITAEAGDAERAALIANSYGGSYLDQRRSAEGARLATAITSFDQRIGEIDAALAQVPAPLTSGVDPAAAQRNELVAQRAQAERSRSDLRLRAAVAAVSSVGEIVDAAEPPADPARPDTARYLAIALLTGLVIGIAAALVRDGLDRSVRLEGGELGDVADLAVLAVVPQPSWWRRSLAGPASREGTAEAFRSLRTVLSNAPSGQPARMVQLVSPRHGRLAAEAVAQAGEAFEQAGHRVLLVSADLRHPRLPDLLDLPVEPGLVSLLLDEATLTDTVRRVDRYRSMLALPPGRLDGHSPDLLASPKLKVVLEQVRAYSEVVFVESPPVLTAADSLEVAADVDGTVLVIAAGKTKTDDVEQALHVLRAVGSTVLGCVVYQAPGR